MFCLDYIKVLASLPPRVWFFNFSIEFLFEIFILVYRTLNSSILIHWYSRNLTIEQSFISLGFTIIHKLSAWGLINRQFRRLSEALTESSLTGSYKISNRKLKFRRCLFNSGSEVIFWNWRLMPLAITRGHFYKITLLPEVTGYDKYKLFTRFPDTRNQNPKSIC